MKSTAVPLICHVINRLDFGGLENGLVNLVNGMSPQRFSHAVICLSGVNPEFRARIRRAEVTILSLDKRPGKDLAVYWRAWHALRSLRPAIVHTRNFGTIDMQWVAAAAGVPHRVHGEHGWDVGDPAGKDPRRRAIRRACGPVIDLYVPMSMDIARWLRDDVRVAPARIRQLYSGVDCNRFRPPESRDDGAGRRIVIGTVGRLDPVKNQIALVRAARTLLDARADLASRFLIRLVGDGEQRAVLEAAVREARLVAQFEFVGARNDVPDQMRDMDVFVLPSINEGISNTILEAMASGLPVVAGRVGGNLELVTDGVTGSLYDPAEETSLPAALVGYLDDPQRRRRQGTEARQRVVREFSLEAMIERYSTLYDELVGRAPAAGTKRSPGN